MWAGCTMEALRIWREQICIFRPDANRRTRCCANFHCASAPLRPPHASHPRLHPPALLLVAHLLLHALQLPLDALALLGVLLPLEGAREALLVAREDLSFAMIRNDWKSFAVSSEQSGGISLRNNHPIITSS